jgi:hypothetical protein
MQQPQAAPGPLRARIGVAEGPQPSAVDERDAGQVEFTVLCHGAFAIEDRRQIAGVRKVEFTDGTYRGSRAVVLHHHGKRVRWPARHGETSAEVLLARVLPFKRGAVQWVSG